LFVGASVSGMQRTREGVGVGPAAALAAVLLLAVESHSRIIPKPELHTGNKDPGKEARIKREFQRRLSIEFYPCLLGYVYLGYRS